MRLAEEPLRTDLDVKGLKSTSSSASRCLRSEREREEVLADVMAVAEYFGLDGGALKAVMSG
jgi:hypothetical protein